MFGDFLFPKLVFKTDLEILVLFCLQDLKKKKKERHLRFVLVAKSPLLLNTFKREV